MIILPVIALSQGVETMTGQNIGAGKPDRAVAATRVAARTLFLVMTGVGILAVLLAEPLVAIFTTDPRTVDAGVRFVYYVAPTFGLFGIMYTYIGGFRGAGKTTTAAALVLVTFGLVQVPVAWFAADVMGPTGVWASFAVSHLRGALIAFGWFRRGTWRRDDPPAGAPAARVSEPDVQGYD